MVDIFCFIKHSSIHHGNFSDCKDIEKIIDNLDYTVGDQKPVVVIDAGIASVQNLATIRKKGYHYLGVSRTKLKYYKFDPIRQKVQSMTQTNKK